MRITSIFAIVAVIASTIANASVVRRSELPTLVQGTWAANKDACSGSDELKLILSPKKYTRATLACEIDEVAVTATSTGSNYSARSHCIDRSTGKENPPSYLIIHPTDNDHILIGSDDDNLTLYQRCR